MKMVICSLAVWSLFFHRPKPPLSDNDLGMFQYLIMQPVDTRGSDNVLVLGESKGWIDALRKDGFKAYGFADREMWQMYYGEVKSYSEIPWRSAAFKIVAVLVKLDRDVLFEVDRLLIPEGFCLIPIERSKYPYEAFFMYLRYARYGMFLDRMEVWRKHGGNLEEAA